MFLGFASDNTAGVHPKIMEAINSVNAEYSRPYGFDTYCAEAEELFNQLFKQKVNIFFTLSGTGANVLALRAIARKHHAIICSELAHIHTDESGAPEACMGAKIISVPCTNAKITCNDVYSKLQDIDNIHKSKPRVLSITQSTEQGTVYTPEELHALCKLARDYNLRVHMDGTRIANALDYLKCDITTITTEVGIDALSFGGTKNGLLLGECLVLFKEEYAEDFMHIRKQSLQLISKMRFIAAQFIAYLKDDLWLKNAAYSNQMAKLFAQKLDAINGIRISRPVEANAIFVIIPPNLSSKLQQEFYFYETDHTLHECRLMTSFATTENEIDYFIERLNKLKDL